MGPETTCLDETTVLQMLDGTLGAQARAAAEAHLARCSACTELTTWAAAHLASPSRGSSPVRVQFIGQLAAGTRVGRYQILGAIGRGGMGDVYAAYHPDLDRRVALKVVREAGAESAERRARLLREARAIARLSHPNVVTVHDAGAVGDRVFIVMEFIDGETVDAWLNAEPRSIDRIVDVFVAAGRGLAAAHAAGIVHRDFKPQNIMVCRDGSVRVMDFGLAWVSLEGGPTGVEPHPPGQAAAELLLAQTVSRVTKTGALLGTPAYMAPEQWRGEGVDARADQYSFCAALHEAVYGSRPRPPHEKGDAAVVEETPDHRRSGRVPAWVRTVLLRGLALEREQRFASVDLLLSALQHGRGKTRRRWLTAAAGAAAAMSLLGIWRLSLAPGFDCSPPVERIERAWDGSDRADGPRQAIRSALSASGRLDAQDIWERLSTALDEHMGRWRAMYRETCEATQVRGEQSADTHDLRMRCLDENLDEVQAMTTVLGRVDRRQLGEALPAVGRLSPVERCADLGLLRSGVRPPREPEVLRKVQGLQLQVKEAWALRELQDVRASYDAAIALRPRAEQTGYKPIIAQALEVAGVSRAEQGGAREGEDLLEQAVFVAEAGHDDLTAARAASNLVFVVGVQQARYAEAERWSKWATAILDRLGGDQGLLRSWILHNEGAVASHRGDYEKALALFRRAIDLKTSALGPAHWDVALSLENLAITLNQVGRWQEALGWCEKAMAILEKSGARDFAGWGVRADILVNLGRYAEADQAYSRMVEIMHQEEIDPDAHHYRGLWLGMGKLRLAMGQPKAALPLFERALAIQEERQATSPVAASAQAALARALWEGGGDRGRARQLAAQARATFTELGMNDRAREVQAWLDGVSPINNPPGRRR